MSRRGRGREKKDEMFLKVNVKGEMQPKKARKNRKYAW